MVSARSSAVVTVSSASAASPMRSLAPGPTTWTPRIRPAAASITTFTNPSVSRRLRARPSAANGNLPTRTAMPRERACSSVNPTVAISGSVKTTPGIAAQSLAAGWPAITSAQTSPSLEALWASIGGPLTSPMA
jgi:hypothetical protein